MSNARTGYLLNRYLNRQITPAELEELSRLLQEQDNDPELLSALEQLIAEMSHAPDMGTDSWDPVLERVLQVDSISERQPATPPAAALPEAPRRVIRLRRWLPYAAAVVMLAALGIVYLRSVRSVPPPSPPPQELAHDILPGGNRATLTLADGTVIDLDKAAKGNISRQGQTYIVKSGNGSVAYKGSSNMAGNASLYNTIATPRGGQYQVLLEDGSKVWLNAASSLKCPVAFSTAQREVEINGEAYFEIAKDPSRPFIVKVNDMQVRVLGTHFNVHDYTGEPLVTTLLEGAVQVNRAGASLTLAPRQEARLDSRGELKRVNNVDVEETVAWKNGYFQFSRANIQSVMRQIARWYDVEVKYEGAIPQDEFVGQIKRSQNLSAVLEILKAGKIKFRVDGRTITVINQ